MYNMFYKDNFIEKKAKKIHANHLQLCTRICAIHHQIQNNNNNNTLI